MVSSNFAVARSFRSWIASDRSYSLSKSRPSRDLATRFAIFLAIVSAHHFQAHGTSGAFHHTNGGVHVGRVQVFQLRFGDLTNLVTCDRTDRNLTRLLGTRLQVGVLLQEVRHRRRLHDEGEGLVLVVRNDNRGRLTLFSILGRRVERLAELDDVDATLTKRRTDRGRRRRRTRGNLKLELACNLLSHFSSALV